MKWEYSVKPLDATKALDEWQAVLNIYGEEGWELVTVTDTSTSSGTLGYCWAIFKRPKSN